MRRVEVAGAAAQGASRRADHVRQAQPHGADHPAEVLSHACVHRGRACHVRDPVPALHFRINPVIRMLDA